MAAATAAMHFSGGFSFRDRSGGPPACRRTGNLPGGQNAARQQSLRNPASRRRGGSRHVQKQDRRTLASAGHLLGSGYSAVNNLFSQTVKLAAASGSTGINGTGAGDRDRKSTRLNSSHSQIS